MDKIVVTVVLIIFALAGGVYFYDNYVESTIDQGGTKMQQMMDDI